MSTDIENYLYLKELAGAPKGWLHRHYNAGIHTRRTKNGSIFVILDSFGSSSAKQWIFHIDINLLTATVVHHEQKKCKIPRDKKFEVPIFRDPDLEDLAKKSIGKDSQLGNTGHEFSSWVFRSWAEEAHRSNQPTSWLDRIDNLLERKQRTRLR